MERRTFLRGIAATVACPVCAGIGSSVAQAADAPHWSYEGHGGPGDWGSLDPAYGACSIGKEQSPVDLNGAIPAMVGDLDIRWRATTMEVVNNGHTIQCNITNGGSLVVDGTEYQLVQFHFHHPSEHTVSGMSREMEVHFVHKSAAGQLAVIGVFFQPGAANATLAPIWSVMPAKAGDKVTTADVINPAAFLPAREVTWRYAGSLTTPPCSEIVSWIVYQDAIEASPEQLKAFATLFPMNARPVQSLNRRKLLVDYF